MRSRLAVLAAVGLTLATAAGARVAGKPAGALVHKATVAPRCGSSKSSGAGAGARRVPRLARVAVVVMENKSCAEVVGRPDAPYETALARRYAFASRYFSLRKPSLPNYLGLTGGSTFGITTDCDDCSVAGTNLVDQLERVGISWKAYMEGMPKPCFTGVASGRYVKRHNPFAYYENVVSDPRRCGRVVPLDELAQDIRNRTLPRFVWISPDVCNDTHSCSIRTGDGFLSRLVPPLLRALGRRGALFLVWDEGGELPGGNRAVRQNVALIVAGGAARRAARSGLSYDHYSLLRTIEDALGLPRLRR